MKKIHIKKAAVAMLLLSSIPGAVLAQTQKTKKEAKEKYKNELYLKAGAAYAFNHGGMIGYAGSSDVTTSQFVIDRKPSSFSAGVGIALGAGLTLSKHVALELGLNQTMASTKYTYTQYVYATATNNVAFNYKAVHTSRSTGLVLASPALVVQSAGEKVNVYTRMGITVPLANRLEIKSTYTAAAEPTLVMIEELYMRPSIGFNAALGASISIGKKADLFGEVSMLSLNPYLKEGHIISYQLNGEEAIRNLTVTQRDTRYEFTSTTSLPLNTNQPNIQSTEHVSYSNFGLTVGVLFHL